MTHTVTFTQQGNIGVLAIDNPPVNALSHAVRIELRERVASSLADPDVEALLIYCEGRTFIAGADIREFGKPPLAPDLPELVEFIAGATRPVIAAIHGAALGGGLELALACHFRVALPSAKLGLPEVTLGILPGAGGTQRLPRLVGVRAALDLILGGVPISASKAHALGLIDEVVEGDLKAAALAFAQRVVAERRPLRRVSELKAELDPPSLFDDYAQRLEVRSRGFLAPFRCLDAVRAAVELPFERGLRRERELFVELMASPQSKAQRHAFFGEREVVKLSELPADTPTREVKSAAVLGGGATGATIARAFADARIPVTLLERTQPLLEAALSSIRELYQSAVAQNELKQAEVDERLARVRPTLAYDELSQADLVIDAMSTDDVLARAAFVWLDALCKPGAILATSTTGLDIDALAAVTQRPEDVMGIAFRPLSSAKLMDNVRAPRTSPATCASAMKLGKSLGKLPVLSRAPTGFVGERMLERGVREAWLLVQEGASQEQVDRVARDFGFPLGPFALSGVPNDPRSSPREAREISELEILERYLLTLVNEGARILEEGVVPRPLEIDMIWLHGYGFPVYRGGPLFYADQRGLSPIYEKILHYREQVGAEHWTPAPLLERLAKAGQGFYGAG